MLTQANYLQNDYNTLAYTTAVKEPRGTSTIVHWQASGRNADGQINSMTIGGIHTTKTYDSLGRVKPIATGTGPSSMQAASYDWDLIRNLKLMMGFIHKFYVGPL